MLVNLNPKLSPIHQTLTFLSSSFQSPSRSHRCLHFKVSSWMQVSHPGDEGGSINIPRPSEKSQL
jgi:hypothetical protein